MIESWVDEGDASAVSAAVVGPSGIREAHAAGAARPRLALRPRLADQADRRPGGDGGGRGGLDRPRRAGRRRTWPPIARGAKAAITPRHLLAHASGLPEVGPRGVPALDVEPVCPPRHAPDLLERGLRRAGRAPGRRRPGSATPSTCTGRCSSRLGWTRSWGCPSRSSRRALDVREPGLWRPGTPLFNSRAWRRRATAAGGAFATCAAYAAIVQLLLRQGAPLIAAETFDEFAAVQFPGLAGGIESFATWERADWGLGCDIRDAKEPHWTGDARVGRDALALRRVRHADVGRPAGRRRARLPGQPRHLLRLDDAPRALGRPGRPRARGDGVRDWTHCPRCAAALERVGPRRRRRGAAAVPGLRPRPLREPRADGERRRRRRAPAG